MSKIKRAFALGIVFVFSGMAFAGCALFERNVSYYNNLEVARVGSDISINKKQLMDAYNNWGYQYVTSNGYSLEQAYNATLDALIDRDIAAKISANMLGFGEDADNFGTGAGQKTWGNVKYTDMETGELKIAVTEYEAAKARKSSYDVLESSLREMENIIRDENNWNGSAAEDGAIGETSEETSTAYTPYEKYLIRQGSGYKINLEKYREETATGHVYATNEAFINYLRQPRGNSEIENQIASMAISRLVRELSQNEKGLGYSYDSINTAENTKLQNEAIIRQLEIIQIEEEKNVLVTRLQEAYEQGLTGVINYSNTDGELEITRPAGYNEILGLRNTSFAAYEEEIASNNKVFVDKLAADAVAEYKYKLNEALRNYEYGIDQLSGYGEKLLTSLEGVYFVPEQVARQFFTVSHILVGYSEEQTEALTKIEEKYKQDANKCKEGDCGECNYCLEILDLRGKVTANMMKDGEATDTVMTAQEVLDFVVNRVNPNSSVKSLAQKVQDFRDCIYMFNTDPGMVNPTFEYVIGADMRTDSSATSTEQDTMTKMVPEFTAAARELFNYNKQENRGGVRKAETSQGSSYIDLRGTVSGLVWSEHGAHIIMYTRNISDFIFTNTADMISDESIQYYLHATQTSYGNKTYFDTIVETITKPAYANYEQQLLGGYKGQYNTTYYKGNYKDLI